MAPAVHVALKVPSDLIERIEHYRAHMEASLGGANPITRADAVRQLVSNALNQFDAQQDTPAGPPVRAKKGGKART